MSETSPDAWRDPWLPVRYTNGTLAAVSLEEFFNDAHLISGFGENLTPVDLDALYRFLVALTGVLYRFGSDSEWESAIAEQRFPASAVADLGASYGDRFNVVGSYPFLQRWDKTQSDLNAAVPAKKALADILKPLEQLHPHVPGASSSEWAVRLDSRDADTWPVIIQLLVTAYFETKNGNGKDPWGCGQTKGSSGTVHTNPFAIFWQHRHNMAATLLANTPLKWADDEDLPLFLDHNPDPSAFNDELSITRFSYAKTLPLLAIVDGEPCGFVLGSDATVPVPALGKDAKDSLGKIHEGDHTRLYVETKKKTGSPLAIRGSFGARLSSTEGFERWFREENGITAALVRWETVERLLKPDPTAQRDTWDFAIFSETTDGKGTRQWADWSVVPAVFAGAKGNINTLIKQLFEFAAVCRRRLALAAKLATGDSRPPLTEFAQTALFSNLQPVIDGLSADVSRGDLRPAREYADQIRLTARRTFEQATSSLLTPSGVTAVAEARAWYDATIKKAFNTDFPRPTDSAEESR